MNHLQDAEVGVAVAQRVLHLVRQELEAQEGEEDDARRDDVRPQAELDVDAQGIHQSKDQEEYLAMLKVRQGKWQRDEPLQVLEAGADAREVVLQDVHQPLGVPPVRAVRGPGRLRHVPSQQLHQEHRYRHAHDALLIAPKLATIAAQLRHAVPPRRPRGPPSRRLLVVEAHVKVALPPPGALLNVRLAILQAEPARHVYDGLLVGQQQAPDAVEVKTQQMHLLQIQSPARERLLRDPEVELEGCANG
mmetsp:Transcript_54017/g.167618  ORF Transcript_54017/g.167618 Transcript_54017/m.167618 type:complete len:248 (-) Transcript_54017:580-1323(-)